MENVNLKKLAQTLNLSVSTVSKALQDSHEISQETKRRVLDLAKSLNYVPNPYASSLRRKKSKTIGVVIPEVTDSFFSLAIKGIESIVQPKGYHTLIYLTYESLAREQTILQEFQSGRVDGVIMSLSGETNRIGHLETLQAKGIPIVLFDRIFDEATMAQITTNDFESGYQATRHLIEQGCRRVAFLSLSDSLSISNQRLEGYKRALAESQIAAQDDLIVNGSREISQELIRTLLQSPQRPDGLLASVEKLAITAYQLCEELNLTIPDAVKIIAFSNLETASLLNPSLTTITQPAFDMGKAAAIALFRNLEKTYFDPQKESIVLPSLLVCRNSTRRCN
ncbi:LacI family DNA-binding transcriptional regulator [Tellurirhabdus bombi]|uniref:LacI family DNA-binding transcriptional regulator n=1 Tax=Tellurirhabdus bombi TaxID=2907205 RepID=UPI001F489A1E|nr:LacI family DNA-binding transcriptional regulator [Tellurirhabdus bombi]